MDFWKDAGPILLAGFVVASLMYALKVVSFRAWARSAKKAEELAEEARRQALDAAPKCVCGELATECMPQLRRSRGALDLLREWFAMPPRYRRVVETGGALCLCSSHAHVADALLDHFIHARIRAAFTKAYSEVAIDVAGFEQERLMVQLSESLTDNQKRATRKSVSTLRVLPKTGTEADGEQQ